MLISIFPSILKHHGEPKSYPNHRSDIRQWFVIAFISLHPSSNAGKILISAVGTNLQALIDGRNDAVKSCTIVRVISNRIKAYGLNRAKEALIPTHYQ